VTVLRKQIGELVSRNESGCLFREIQHQSEESAALFDKLAERRQSGCLSEKEIAGLRRKLEGCPSFRTRRLARQVAGGGVALLRKAIPRGASHNLASRWFRMLRISFQRDLDPRRSPVPLDHRFRSVMAPFVAFKRELCRSLPLDLSGLLGWAFGPRNPMKKRGFWGRQSCLRSRFQQVQPHVWRPAFSTLSSRVVPGMVSVVLPVYHGE
jgi:hypothetical protein